MKIRRATPKDTGGMFELERAIVQAGDGVVKYPDELPETAADYHDAVIKRVIGANDSSTTLVVELPDGRLVGEASLERMPFRMIRHTAVLALGVHPDFRRRGIGDALMKALLDEARGLTCLWRIELNVRADNEGAIALYRKHGFELEGTRKRFLLSPEGKAIDDHLMAALL